MSIQAEPPAETRLIQQRREATVPPMSRRQAAAAAGISASQWSDIERGSKKAGHGAVVPIRATAETLARMARAVGASAAELAEAGRQDAADLMDAIDEDRNLRQRLGGIPGIGISGITQLTGADGQELLPLIAAGLDAIEASSLSPAAKRELTAMFTRGLVHDAAQRYRELVLMLSLADSAGQPR